MKNRLFTQVNPKRPFRYFYYGWAAHLAAILVIFIIDLVGISIWYPDGDVPDYANAAWNLMFRFPAWSGITLFGTIYLISRKLPNLRISQKMILVLLNLIVVISLTVLLIIFTPLVVRYQLYILVVSIVLLMGLILCSNYIND